MLKITTKDDENKDLKYETEKQDHENILKCLKIDNDYDRKYENLNKKKKNWFFLKIYLDQALP